MKPLWRLGIAAALLAVVVVAIEWPKRAATAPPDAPALVKFDPTAVVRMQIAQPGQPTVVVTRSGDTWKLDPPYAWAADPSVVSGVISALGDITGAQDAGSTNGAAFGLDTPSEVQLTLKAGAPLDFQFGADSPVGGNTYLRVGASGPIKIVPSYVKESAVKNAFMLQDKTVLHFTADQVTSLELMDAGKTLELARKDGAWPKDQDTNVTSLLEALQSGQMTALPDPTGKDAAQEGLDHPTAYLHLLWPNGKGQIEIGAKKGAAEYYARSSDGPGVFTVSDYLVQDMNTLANPPKPVVAGTPSPK